MINVLFGLGSMYSSALLTRWASYIGPSLRSGDDKNLKRPETALAAYDLKAVGEQQPSWARLGRTKASAPTPGLLCYHHDRGVACHYWPLRFRPGAFQPDHLTRLRRNQTQAARLLRITRDTLRYKMKKFNLR